jgi:hypothetical protein
MLRRRVPVSRLSLSLWLTGCAAYDLDERGYSNSRYPSYGDSRRAYPDVRERYYQPQNNYPIIGYQQYPSAQNDRYRLQRQPVYYYRQVPAGYWPAWQGQQAEDRHNRHHRHQYAPPRDRDRYDDRREHYQRRGEQQGGWTLRIN